MGIIANKNIGIEVCGDDILRCSFEPFSKYDDIDDELSNIQRNDSMNNKEKFVNSIPENKEMSLLQRKETKLRKPTDFKLKDQTTNKLLFPCESDVVPSIGKTVSEQYKKLNKGQSQGVPKSSVLKTNGIEVIHGTSPKKEERKTRYAVEKEVKSSKHSKHSLYSKNVYSLAINGENDLSPMKKKKQ